jgi:hypothetical protein
MAITLQLSLNSSKSGQIATLSLFLVESFLPSLFLVDSFLPLSLQVTWFATLSLFLLYYKNMGILNSVSGALVKHTKDKN